MALALAAAPLGVRDWRMLDAYPAQYVARRLAPSESIAVDGRLDDDAWRSVPWTEGMVDITRQLTLSLTLTVTLTLTLALALTLTLTSAELRSRDSDAWTGEGVRGLPGAATPNPTPQPQPQP